MKKKIIGVLVLSIFLISMASAFEFDNVKKSYNPETRTALVKNMFGLGGDIVEAQLITPQVMRVIPGEEVKVAEFGIKPKTDYAQIVKGIKTYNYNTKSFEEKSYTLKYLDFETIPTIEHICQKGIFENGTEYCNWLETRGSSQESRPVWKDWDRNALDKNDLVIGVFTSVEEGDHYDWIPTIAGVEIEEWAEFTGASLYEYYKTAPSSFDFFGTARWMSQCWTPGVVGKDGGYTIQGVTLKLSKTNSPSGDAVAMIWSSNASANSTSGVSNTFLGGGTVAMADLTTSPADYNLTINNSIFVSADTQYCLTINAPATDSGNRIKASYDGTGGYNGGNLFYSTNTMATWGLISSVPDDLYFEIWGFSNPLPQITLNEPSNTTTVFNPNVVFNITATDDDALVNMSLIVNGTTESTNSTPPLNNTKTSFSYTLPTTGLYTWTGEACDSEDECNTSAVYHLTYANQLTVALNDPVNAYNSTSSTIIFNATGSDDTSLENMTLYIDGVLNTTNSSAINNTLTQFPLNLADGNYNWTVEACDNLATCVTASARNFTVDTSAPLINITEPIGDVNYGIQGKTENINWTYVETNPDTCIVNYNSTNTTITCTSNSTLTIQKGVYTASLFANDTLGSWSVDTSTWDYKIFENNQTFNPSTIEGSLEDLYANISLLSGYTINEANLVYNGTATTGTSTLLSGSDYQLAVEDISIPTFTADTNYSFYWSITLDSGEIINLTTYNQTSYDLTIDDCTTNNITLFNFTSLDEELQIPLNDTEIEIAVNLYTYGGATLLLNVSGLYTDNPTAICSNIIIDNSTAYSVDSIIRYEAIGYANEYYNIVNFTLDSDSLNQNITLYDLNITDTTDFQLTFTGDDFLPVENALIYVNRQYIAENTFKTVELPKTDSNGQTILHLVRNDVIYNIVVVKNGLTLGTFNNVIAFCDDFTIGSCTLPLNALDNATAVFNYDEATGITFPSGPVYNDTAQTISFSFTSTDGTSKEVQMNVERRDVFGNISICNNTVISTSGTLSCNVGSVSDTYLFTSIQVNNETTLTATTPIDTSAYGNIGFVVWFFLTLVSVLMFGGSKNGVLIGLIASYIGAVSLGIVVGGVIGVGSSGVWILIVTLTALWKINSTRRD